MIAKNWRTQFATSKLEITNCDLQTSGVKLLPLKGQTKENYGHPKPQNRYHPLAH